MVLNNGIKYSDTKINNYLYCVCIQQHPLFPFNVY